MNINKRFIFLLAYFSLHGATALSDPCLEYQPNTNHCKVCDKGYKYALINETTTLCAYSDGVTCWLNDSYYSSSPSFNSTFNYYETYTVNHQYCFNCTSFYQLPNGDNLCYSDCPQTEPKDFLSLTVDEQSLGCHTCALQDYQMNTILDYSFIDLYVKTCTKNSNDVACTWLEFYDPETQRCVPCSQKFSKCSACNSSQCLITSKQYSEGIGLFNYTSRTFDMNQLIFYVCPKRMFGSTVDNGCEATGIPHCLQSSKRSSGFEFCWICEPSYKYSYPRCIEKNHDTTQFTFFIKSGAKHTTSEDLEALYFQNSGTIPSDPFFFLGQAIQVVMARNEDYYYQNVTFYLGRGNHFFFYCNSLSGTVFNSPDIIKYCDSHYSHLEQPSVGSDNMDLYFQPLYCSLGSDLGYELDDHFLAMCVRDTDPNPTIFVNQAYAYFQIYKYARFENLHFTGVNQLVRPVKLTDDLSSIPVQFCTVTEEPLVGEQALKLEKFNIEDLQISYKCINLNYTGSYIPQSSNSTFTCNRNQQQKFTKEQESTLTCSGEPAYPYYFGESYYYNENIQRARRTNTLFNLIALAEYQSLHQEPPQLELINCTFEYFLQNYESLIKIQTNDYHLQEYGLKHPRNPQDIDPYTFLMSSSGERGAKIHIYNSEFKHSSFCKGLIAYRKQHYIDLEKMGVGNYSYYMMEFNPYVVDDGSYIVLEKSKFYNLNSAFQNISALAIYGGQEVMRELNLLGGNSQSYQAFIHKGTVLNLEDFGGFIEIKDCSFESNMHFIPQIFNSPMNPSEKKGMEEFIDSSYTFEYKLAICDAKSHTDKYLFSHGLSKDDDIDSLYDSFERLSLIYISRNRDMVVIKNNTFHSNIGTFGGAISINSQNWEAGKEPFVVIEGNEFKNNMAYLSGNAIYIRNSFKNLDATSTCGGITIHKNVFDSNIGTTMSNGGAVSLLCYQLSDQVQQDYFSSSNQKITDSLDATVDLLDPWDNTSITVWKHKVNIETNTFRKNMAGSKGSALYIKELNSIKISNNEFIENGPVLSQLELEVSPYVKYFSQRPFSYTDESGTCSNEFEYISECLQLEQQLSWSVVFGAVYVEQCQDSDCLGNGLVQQLTIEDSLFQNNQAGYVLDPQFGPNTTSQIQIVGGVSNSIRNCTFSNTSGLYESLLPQKLKDFFPTYYFGYQQAALISISYMLNYDLHIHYNNVIANCSFERNNHSQVLGLGSDMHYQGSLIRITSPFTSSHFESSVLLTISESKFYQNIFVGAETQLIYAQNVMMKVEKSVFTLNGGTVERSQPILDGEQDYTLLNMLFLKENWSDFQNYGLFYIDGVQKFEPYLSHNFSHNQFSGNVALKSTILHINLGNQFLFLEKNAYLQNIAITGGIFGTAGNIFSNLYHLAPKAHQVVTNTSILLQQEDFQQQFSVQGIFSMIVDNEHFILNLIVENSAFLNNFARHSYSTLSLSNLGKVIIKNSTFKVSYFQDIFEDYLNSHVLEDSSMLNLILSNVKDSYPQGSKFLSANNTWNGEDAIYFRTEEVPINQNYREHLEVINCDFENFHSDSGGVITTLSLQSKLLMINNEEEDKRITNCSVKENGLFFISESEFIGLNLQIEGSSSKSAVALFYLTQSSNLILFSSSFLNNKAYTYGMLYVTGSSRFTCEDCTFRNNSVTVDSSILYADNNPAGMVVIRNSDFRENNSTSNLMTLVTTPSNITNSTFLDNYAQLINNGITTTNSQLVLNQVLINYTDPSFINENDFSVDTCFLNINFQSVLIFENSTVENCRGGTAGFLQATGYSSVFIKDKSVFRNSLSSTQGSGSALYFQTTNEVTIEDSYFQDNGIRDIYIQRSTMSILNSNFEGGHQQFVYGQAAGINIIGSTFMDASNLEIQGKALFCNCFSLNITGSLFSNLQSVIGGALYLTSSSENSQFELADNTFSNNKAQQGGAIYIQDAKSLIIKNNTFIENKAQVSSDSELSLFYVKKGLGGAIFFECQNTQAKLFNNCQYEVSPNNLFQRNFAQDQGGALMITASNSLYEHSNNYELNQADYGEDIAFSPSHLKVVFHSNNDYYNPTAERQVFTRGDSLVFENIVSGTAFSFEVSIMDQEERVYSNDNLSVASLKNLDSSKEILLNGNEVKAEKGIFNFTSITAVTKPGDQLKLTLEISNLIDFGIPISFIEEPLSITLSFRNCVSGEQMLNYACEQCPYGYYLYEPPLNNTPCKTCQENSECLGKNIVFPQQSYWRSHNQSEEWVKCPRLESCLEGDTDHLTSNCQEGYEGKVCGLCSQGFSRTSRFECSKCPPKSKNITKISFILVAVILVVMLLVYSTSKNSNKSNIGYSVYIKIMTSHFQIINALANVNFSWPNAINDIYKGLIAVSSMNEQIFSIDCFLMESNSRVFQSIGVYFTKLLFYGLLPVILAFWDFVFWMVYSLITGKYKDFQSRFISTLVILLFLVHPTITQEMLQSFNCIQIGEIYYLRDDLSFECYTGTHMKFLIIIVIPSVVVWCLGIPLVVLIVLWRNRKVILKEEAQRSLEERERMMVIRKNFGFIFNGFRPQMFYYEVVIQYRKVLLILITVTLSVVSPEIQSLLSFLILALSMIYQYQQRPFLTSALNRMELLSLLVSTTTLYAGMYFITGQHYDYYQSQFLQWFFFILLMLPNFAYFFYWLYYMVIECLKVVHTKSKTLFKIVTLGLCDYSSFYGKYLKQPISPLDQEEIEEKKVECKEKPKSNRFCQDEDSVFKSKEPSSLEGIMNPVKVKEYVSLHQRKKLGLGFKRYDAEKAKEQKAEKKEKKEQPRKTQKGKKKDPTARKKKRDLNKLAVGMEEEKKENEWDDSIRSNMRLHEEGQGQ